VEQPVLHSPCGNVQVLTSNVSLSLVDVIPRRSSYVLRERRTTVLSRHGQNTPPHLSTVLSLLVDSTGQAVTALVVNGQLTALSRLVHLG